MDGSDDGVGGHFAEVNIYIYRKMMVVIYLGSSVGVNSVEAEKRLRICTHSCVTAALPMLTLEVD